MFVLNSDITIETAAGKTFRWSGVHNCEIHRSIHTVAHTAVLQVPAFSKTQKASYKDGQLVLKPGTRREIMLASEVHDGDRITIQLGYNGDLKTEFKGFIKRRVPGRPVSLECEGYSRQMRLNVHLNGYLPNTTVKELLEIAVGIRDAKGQKLATPLTDIKVSCQVDVPLVRIRMLANANGLQVIDEIKKLTQGALSIFFIKPDVLWCGLPYTPYVDNADPFGNGRAAYRLGYNCIKDNGLKERVVSEPIQVILKGKLATGQLVQGKSQAKTATSKAQAVVNNIPDDSIVQRLAHELQLRRNYQGYEGALSGFLQPFVEPGYQVTVKDREYQERDGIYMAESTTVTFGINGARRKVQLGPRIGFIPG